jgi:CelD/BcsL family acetyltransferase involved in cellulose biosynthesis
LNVESIRPQALSEGDLAAWRAIQAQVPGFSTPLLAPEFAQVVGQFREDTRIAVLRDDGGQGLAFFPHQLRPDGLARCLGAPFGDYQAILAPADLHFSGPDFLKGAGIRRFRFCGLMDPQKRLPMVPGDGETGYQIVLQTCGQAYMEDMRAANPKRVKNLRRLENKTEREIGPLSFNSCDQDPHHLDQLLDWKAQQMTASGVTNVLRPMWVRAMMHALHATRQGDFSGLMMTLWAGETLLAGHFGIRLGDTYHPWMAVINPDHHAQSPGQTYLSRAILAMPSLGLRVYDMGTGHSHYKAPFCNVTNTLGCGLYVADRAGPMPHSGGLVSRVTARLDHIASVELSMGGRLSGLAAAIKHAGTRMRSREQDAANEIGA